jgi:hypothetical protein
MLKRSYIVVVAAMVLLAGCGGQTLTDKDIDQMGQDKALNLLDCQIEKLAEERGDAEAQEAFIEAFDDSMREDGPTVQVRLWKMGYQCPEYL